MLRTTQLANITPEVASARGRIAALSRSRETNDPALIEAKSALAEAKLMSAIERLIAGAPPFTPEQSFRLRNLLDAKAVSNG